MAAATGAVNGRANKSSLCPSIGNGSRKPISIKETESRVEGPSVRVTNRVTFH